MTASSIPNLANTRFILYVITLVVGLLGGNAASAHPSQDGAVFLDIGRGEVNMELHLPVDQLYSVAQNIFPDGRPAENIDEALTLFSNINQSALEDYLYDRITLRTPNIDSDGNNQTINWEQSLKSYRVEKNLDDLKLVALVNFLPENKNINKLGDIFIYYDVIVDRMVTHKALVTLRHDFDLGVLPEHALILPPINRNNKDIVVDRESASALHGSFSLFQNGVVHILEGTDHILFLLCLILASPMMVIAGAWQPAKSSGTVMRRGLFLVSAFTLGHTIMFFLASLDLIRLPSQLVEIAVAFTIMVSAANLLIPFMKEKMLWVACLFGLVHGLAFATSLSVLGFSGSAKILTLVSFTLGIEAVQGAILLLTLPAFVELSRSHFRYYRLFLYVAAPLIFFAGLFWALQRMEVMGELAIGNLDNLNQSMPYMLVVLWAVAATSVFVRWYKQNRSWQLSNSNKSESPVK